ncbi:MAG: GntR family transcriptional regulator [Acidobacteriota bacterium]|jgi:GntR family transcriptional regulator|nr:GntR family transcriptional regulator [Bryobacteraceae bacterium CoA2 C42]MCA2965651.1 GntR family transcriptional regulator [Acidobacteriaceae bacterium]
MPPLLSIDLHAPLPAYRQIVDAIRTHLVNGALQPGDLLPPVRRLAIDLGVHFNTVADAYRILAEEGWLDLKRRRGALVLARTAPRPIDPAVAASFARRLRELVAEVRAAGVTRPRILRELRLIAKGLES